MKALSLVPQAGLQLIDLPEPEIQYPHQVKLKILEVGICGTDREQVVHHNIHQAAGPEGLVIGHEMLGQVVETGPEVQTVQKGDYGVLTVRRGCRRCSPCKNNRSDMCYTGLFKERGIKGIHGFETEYVVDDEQYLVRVPDNLKSVGVLTEPLSVAEKAIEEALLIQGARLPKVAGENWLWGKKTLVAGIGPIGLLAAMALRLRGAEVIGLDIVDERSRRPDILKKLGGSYVNSKETSVQDLDDKFGQIDFIFEATGVPELGFQLIDALGVNGIYVMTGIPHGERPVCIMGAELMNQIVLLNQLILGSVNASTQHYELAVQDLQKAKKRWGSLVEEIITTRVNFKEFANALDFRSVDDIKTIIEWSR